MGPYFDGLISESQVDLKHCDDLRMPKRGVWHAGRRDWGEGWRYELNPIGVHGVIEYKAGPAGLLSRVIFQ